MSSQTLQDPPAPQSIMPMVQLRPPPTGTGFYTSCPAPSFKQSVSEQTIPLSKLPTELQLEVFSHLPPPVLVKLCSLDTSSMKIQHTTEEDHSTKSLEDLKAFSRSALQTFIQSTDTIPLGCKTAQLYWEFCNNTLLSLVDTESSFPSITPSASTKQVFTCCNSSATGMDKPLISFPHWMNHLILTDDLRIVSYEGIDTLISPQVMPGLTHITLENRCLTGGGGIWFNLQNTLSNTKSNKELRQQLLSGKSITINISEIPENYYYYALDNWPLYEATQMVLTESKDSDVLINCPERLVPYLLGSRRAHQYSKLTLRVPRSAEILSDTEIGRKAIDLARPMMYHMRSGHGKLELWDFLGTYHLEREAQIKNDKFWKELNSQVNLATGMLDPGEYAVLDGFADWKEYLASWLTIVETEIPKTAAKTDAEPSEGTTA